MVFYFTGTGNSLYVAKRLEKNPVSIPQIIKNKTLEFTADVIGIVAPVYGHEMPPMVKDFLHKAVFCTDYFYIILTYGNRHGGASELAEAFCRECGITPSYINVLLMVDNWLPGFDMDEQRSMDKKTEEHLAEIIADVRDRGRMISEVTEADREVHQRFLQNRKKLPDDAWKKLIKVTHECVGCGLCTKVCPSGSMQMEGGKAVHIPERCQTCLACIHSCPNKALNMDMPEKNPSARYRNEHIRLEELIEANNQDTDGSILAGAHPG